MSGREPISQWGVVARRHPSALLLLAQLGSLVLYAVFESSSYGRVVVGAFGIVVLMLVVWVIRRSPAFRWISWFFMAPVFVLSPLSLLLQDPRLVILSSSMEAVLYFYASGSLITYMLGDYRVTVDELFAAAATFTLIAWGFAYAYLACEIWRPGSFIGGTEPRDVFSFLEHLSQSFAHLSGVGLADITPGNAAGRVLVMLEQFVGVAYVAVVVTRLIGMTIVRERMEVRKKSR